MVDFKWIITEDLVNYPFEGDPRKEDLDIGGDFCMMLNNQKWGDVLPAEAYETIEGLENLMYLFEQFKEKVLPLDNYAEANVRSVLLVRIVLVFTRVNDKLFISEKINKTGEIRWTVEVGFREFCKVCEANIKEFRETVIKRNPILAENESIKRLS